MELNLLGEANKHLASQENPQIL